MSSYFLKSFHKKSMLVCYGVGERMKCSIGSLALLKELLSYNNWAFFILILRLGTLLSCSIKIKIQWIASSLSIKLLTLTMLLRYSRLKSFISGFFSTLKKLLAFGYKRKILEWISIFCIIYLKIYISLMTGRALFKKYMISKYHLSLKNKKKWF